MSLATLKKKTAHKYNNNSVNRTVFSINGTHRSQGYIGQTSLSRTFIHTPKKNDVPQGHGGCCGMYPVQDIQNSSVCTTEKSNVVKNSVLSSRGMLAKRNRWVKRPAPFSSTKPSDSINQNTSGDYIVYKRKNTLKDIRDCMVEKDVDHVSGKCCKPIVTDKSELASQSQSDYVLGLIAECATLDVSYIEYSTNPGLPFAFC